MQLPPKDTGKRNKKRKKITQNGLRKQLPKKIKFKFAISVKNKSNEVTKEYPLFAGQHHRSRFSVGACWGGSYCPGVWNLGCDGGEPILRVG
jgi:hypothetical protein